jgi:hypothetical protein
LSSNFSSGSYGTFGLAPTIGDYQIQIQGQLNPIWQTLRNYNFGYFMTISQAPGDNKIIFGNVVLPQYYGLPSMQIGYDTNWLSV